MRGSSTASIESAIEFLNLLPQNNSQKTVFVCNGCCWMIGSHRNSIANPFHIGFAWER